MMGIDDRIEINQAAFRHGIVAESIRYVVNHPCYEGPLEDDEQPVAERNK